MKCTFEQPVTEKADPALRMVFKILDDIVDKVLMLFFLLIFLAGVYSLYDSYMVYSGAVDSNILKFKPGYGGDISENDEQIQGIMAGWITMDGTDIDYPVMQGSDNSEYLSKDPFGRYSLAGSIFLDARNSTDFSDTYSLIYGHHMERGMMFGALDAWLNEDYAATHMTGELITDEKTYELSVFAVAEVPATSEMVFSPTETSPEKTLKYIEQKAKFLFEQNKPGDGDRFIALSTCKSPDTSERTIIFCRMD